MTQLEAAARGHRPNLARAFPTVVAGEGLQLAVVVSKLLARATRMLARKYDTAIETIYTSNNSEQAKFRAQRGIAWCNGSFHRYFFTPSSSADNKVLR